MIEYTKYSLVGDWAEDEETLGIFGDKKHEELPSGEAVAWAKQIVRDLKQNITELERDILWCTDREKHFTYYEDRKKVLDKPQ